LSVTETIKDKSIGSSESLLLSLPIIPLSTNVERGNKRG
jgi:hypothetical protein